MNTINNHKIAPNLEYSCGIDLGTPLEDFTKRVSDTANETFSTIETLSFNIKASVWGSDFSSYMWHCTGKIKSVEGYVYTFKLKDNFNYLNTRDIRALRTKAEESSSALDEIFPSTEPDAAMVLVSDVESFDNYKDTNLLKKDLQREVKPLIHYHEEINKLGIKICVKDSECYLELPDRKTLLANWKKLQETIPNLEDLKIGSGEGLIDNLNFIASCLENETILASGIQFVHDFIFHVIPTIHLKIESAKSSTPFFQSEREKIHSSIREHLSFSKSLKGNEYKLYIHALTCITDRAFACSKRSQLQKFRGKPQFNHQMRKILKSHLYMKKEFGYLLTKKEVKQLIPNNLNNGFSCL